MKSSTRNILIGSALSTSAALAINSYRLKKRSPNVLPDVDHKRSLRVDRMESVDANKDPEEKGLTQLDSAYRSDWQANGFPQTHMELEELEKK
ncbi:hypothetical protein SAMN04488137_3240 [Fictibacillus solisalsi]|uniref:Uncharacterized protein n=1 Tax=Fictibacillus solisalsi TaxID=459525 RepID=A0A1G9Y6U8_9BACL|nr:hypothetical protein [Fictibacillus solisalsi]SDN04797.1 hypothetical protein SAMN04488137_3240 [Fictibacillus solisalsi]